MIDEYINEEIKFRLIVYYFEDNQEKYTIGKANHTGMCKVTNAKGGQSKHNFGLAVDFAFVINGELCWDEDLYQNLGRWAEKCDLNWGGDWRSFLDLPHVEL